MGNNLPFHYFICVIFAMVVVFGQDDGFKSSEQKTSEKNDRLDPSVMVVLLARNKAHVLPIFLTLFSGLDYPKDRISIWIRSDHNNDKTEQILNAWLNHERNNYHSVDFHAESVSSCFPDEVSAFDWSTKRFEHIIRLKEHAMLAAKKQWADFIWFLDCDVLLTNPNTLRILINKEKMMIAPMLNSLKHYSNFWCGMDQNHYYVRTNEYIPIQSGKNKSVHAVPMIHSAVLIDLGYKKCQQLTFDRSKLKKVSSPLDDIIILALGAADQGIKMYVTNEEDFGYITVPLDADNQVDDDLKQLQDIKIHALNYDKAIAVAPYLNDYIVRTKIDNMGFDQIYLINLARRPNRRKRMLATLRELGLRAKTFEAFDGKVLNDSYLEQMGVKQLPSYLDPIHLRAMKYGEIGCFLSHYKIWQEIVANKYKQVIVFEDDVKFASDFKAKLRLLLFEAESVNAAWDLIYLGRKVLTQDDLFVPGTTVLVNVSYSHWTVGYVITFKGAKKLLNANPLTKLIPVDEYIPIMYDRHPQSEWKSHFVKRDLKAYGVYPTLIEPTHYLGQPGYITDTEDSVVIDDIVDLSVGKLSSKDEL